jgi:hypothetical protein
VQQPVAKRAADLQHAPGSRGPNNERFNGGD